MKPRTNRAYDYLPPDLHSAVVAIAHRDRRTLTQVWDWAVLQACADVADAQDGGPVHPLPQPVDPASIVDRVKIAWKVQAEDELEQLRLITLGGSTRTAILICAAEVYRAVDGDLMTLLRARQPGQRWGELPH